MNDELIVNENDLSPEEKENLQKKLDNDEIFERYVQSMKEAKDIVNEHSFECFSTLDDICFFDTNDAEWNLENHLGENWRMVLEQAREGNLDAQEDIMRAMADHHSLENYGEIDERYNVRNERREMAFIANGVNANAEDNQFVQFHDYVVYFEGEIQGGNFADDGIIVKPTNIVKIIKNKSE